MPGAMEEEVMGCEQWHVLKTAPAPRARVRSAMWAGVGRKVGGVVWEGGMGSPPSNCSGRVWCVRVVWGHVRQAGNLAGERRLNQAPEGNKCLPAGHGIPERPGNAGVRVRPACCAYGNRVE